jgi:hypothetical protein
MAAAQDSTVIVDLTSRIQTFSLLTWCGMPKNVNPIMIDSSVVEPEETGQAWLHKLRHEHHLLQLVQV